VPGATVGALIGPWAPWRPRFALLTLISDAGSEGQVWLAQERGDGQVALKIHGGADGPLVPPFDRRLLDRLEGLEALAAVMGRIEGLVRCRSPFVGPVPLPPGLAPGSHGEPDPSLPSCVYLPMELVEGQSLATLLLRMLGGDTSFSERWSLMGPLLDVGQALSAMGACEPPLVHGDVAPRNIVVMEQDGRLRGVLVDPNLMALAPGAGTQGREWFARAHEMSGSFERDETGPDWDGWLDCVALLLLREPRAAGAGELATQGERLAGLFEGDLLIADLWTAGLPGHLQQAMVTAAGRVLHPERSMYLSQVQQGVELCLDAAWGRYERGLGEILWPLSQPALELLHEMVSLEVVGELGTWLVAGAPQPQLRPRVDGTFWTDPIDAHLRDLVAPVAVELNMNDPGGRVLMSAGLLSELRPAARAIARALVHQLRIDDGPLLQGDALLTPDEWRPLRYKRDDPLGPMHFAEDWTAASSDPAELLALASGEIALRFALRVAPFNDHDDE
jgi:hypothetical protein